jgi:hypothetical protein
MHNKGDDPIRRASGVILWHLEHGGDAMSAVAKASVREPQLSEDQLRYALGWALASQRFRDLANSRAPCPTVERLPEGGFKTTWDKDCDPHATIQSIAEESGLAAFQRGEGRPPDV